MQMQINSCIISSFIFLTNSFVAYTFNMKIYAFLFLLLWITSLIYHTRKNIYTNILDKLVIFTIFTYGLYLFCIKPHSNLSTKIIKFFIILSFLLTLFLYIYGEFYKTIYQIQTQQFLHSVLHIIGSIGHHLIVLL